MPLMKTGRSVILLLGKLKKKNSPHRVSNLRPSGLKHSASTTTAEHRDRSGNDSSVRDCIVIAIKWRSVCPPGGEFS
jgi:hypothetical protein